MKNITKTIREVTSNNINWEHSIFYLTLDVLNNNGFKMSFWNNEENWASIIEDEKIKGYVWKKYPLIVCEKDIILNIENLVSNIENISCIEVDSLTKDLFKIDDHSLYNYFSDGFDFESFTMEDFWFYTNSI